MKIVLISDSWSPLIGGGQKLFAELTSRLVRDHRCQITVVTRALRYDKKVYAAGKTYFNNRLKIIRLGPALAFFNPFGRFWFIFQSAFYALKFKPDIYLASTWLPAISLQLIKLFKKTPVVLVAIGFGSRLQWLERLITQKFKYNLVITDDLTLNQAKFIPNGVDLPRRQAGLPKHKNFTFLTIARNEPRKGIPILLKAFAQVKKQFPKSKLRLFGPGFTTISQSQLEKELFKAHCLVLPSLAEGHPLVLFEAWAHQLPVIATDVGSVSQFVNGDNGYLVPAGDAQTLARTMKLAIQNPSLAVMGANGYQLVSQHYSWSKTISQYHQALSKLSNIQ